MSDPAPLTPPECDLRDYPWMPLDVRRLLTSETWMDGPAEGKVAALSLWCEAWCQVPAGSLPDNDRILSHLSQTGAAWKKVRVHALRGWIKCSDGRLYHPVVCEKAMEAWNVKLAQRKRTEAARKAKQDRKLATTTESGQPPVTEPVTVLVTEPVTSSVTEIVTGSTVQDKTRQYLKEERAEASASDAEPASGPPSARELVWSEGLPLMRHVTGKSDAQCRALLGQLLRDLCDDCPKALLILQQARDTRPVDPVAWLRKATTNPERKRESRNGFLELSRRLDAGEDVLGAIFANLEGNDAAPH